MPMPMPAFAPLGSSFHLSESDFGGGLLSCSTVVELPLRFESQHCRHGLGERSWLWEDLRNDLDALPRPGMVRV